MKSETCRKLGLAGLAGLACLSLTACDDGEGTAGGIPPRQMADALHAVLSADRTIYTRMVVDRLQNQEKIIEATEHWRDKKGLPLPSQMFRYGSELVAETNTNFSYQLLSLWPLNKQNGPRTEGEKAGLRHIADHPGENYYVEETLGETRYFTAVYPDKAVADACVTCHNKHRDSPRTDFKLGEIMGGVVIRISSGKGS
jgi:hypothetical protein